MSDEKQGWHDLGLSDQVTRRKLLVAAIAVPVLVQRLGSAPTRNDPPEPLV